jgi:hypothetical protein
MNIKRVAFSVLDWTTLFYWFCMKFDEKIVVSQRYQMKNTSV